MFLAAKNRFVKVLLYRILKDYIRKSFAIKKILMLFRDCHSKNGFIKVLFYRILKGYFQKFFFHVLKHNDIVDKTKKSVGVYI